MGRRHRKRDLDQLEERMDLRFQNVDLRFDNVDSRLDEISEIAGLRFSPGHRKTRISASTRPPTAQIFVSTRPQAQISALKVEKRIDAQADRIISKLLTILVPLIAVAVAFLTAMSV
ncbi:MAG: hypothetical protein IPO44_02155 [Candidatus Microthrix sp.]|nr:hypothetical protein [Candidatus Microthrix sp.]MBK9558412.1 hypothetical protein [Candidatus Microthrix sp.]